MCNRSGPFGCVFALPRKQDRPFNPLLIMLTILLADRFARVEKSDVGGAYSANPQGFRVPWFLCVVCRLKLCWYKSHEFLRCTNSIFFSERDDDEISPVGQFPEAISRQPN